MLAQVNGLDSMSSKIDFEKPVLNRWSQGHRIAAKRFADAQLAIAKKDLAIDLHFAHLVDRSVLQRRQLFRKRSLADLISTRRHVHVQSFMRSHVIVAVAPFIKTSLHRFKVAKDPLGQYFNFQTAMKAFVFALGLRMIRPTVANAPRPDAAAKRSTVCTDARGHYPRANHCPSACVPAIHNGEKWP